MLKLLIFLIVFVGFQSLSFARGQRSLTTQEKIDRNSNLLRTERNQGKRTNLIKEIEDLQAELNHASIERAFDQSLPAKAARTQDDKLCESLCAMAKNHQEYSTFAELERIARDGHQMMSREELEQLITPKENAQPEETMGRHIAAATPLPAPEREERECLKLEELLVPGMEVDESIRARLIEFINKVNGDHCPKY